MNYRDPVIELLITKLREAKIPQIKEYFHGDIIVPNKRDLPLLYIAKDGTDIGQETNMEDGHTMNFVIVLLYDLTTDIGQNYDMAAGVTSMYEIVEGRDANYAPLSNSIVGALRANQGIDAAKKLWINVRTPLRTAYGLTVNRRGPGMYSVEATVRCTLELHTPRPGLPQA